MAAQEIEQLIDGYLAAWSEPDPQARRAHLERVWDADGVYTDPNAHAAGIDALDAHIGGFHQAAPGATFTLSAPIDHHHEHVRFYWVLRVGGQEIPGMDYGEISADGKLTRIVGFF